MHELTGNRLCEPHERRPNQRKECAIQAFRAETQGLVTRLTPQIERPAQQAREQSRDEKRPKQHADLPQHDRLAEIAREVAEHVRKNAVLHDVAEIASSSGFRKRTRTS